MGLPSDGEIAVGIAPYQAAGAKAGEGAATKFWRLRGYNQIPVPAIATSEAGPFSCRIAVLAAKWREGHHYKKPVWHRGEAIAAVAWPACGVAAGVCVLIAKYRP